MPRSRVRGLGSRSSEFYDKLIRTSNVQAGQAQDQRIVAALAITFPSKSSGRIA
jgi:hypothetical protein